MLRKNRGSILIITVFVFLLVNIIAITCSEIILSNNKYTKYNYEDVYIKEQCLSKIEIIYSNILKEVEIALDESGDFNSFQNYFTDNNSSHFINKISDISEISIDDKSCQISKIDIDDDSDCICYKIISEVEYRNFNKTMVAYVKIKNPFDKEQVYDNEDSKDQNNESEYLKDTSINEKSSEIENIDSDKTISQNIEANQENKEGNKKNIKPGDLVILFGCEEV